jgi:DNA-directed RNA polymerase II subunit RPB1
VSIEEVPNTTPYAYDLTVERTRNFVIANSLACQDTFHNVGILSKTNATRGVPRIDEILSLSKEIKSPSLTVFLKQEDRTHKDRAQELMYKMEHTTLGELVNTTAIYFDPDDLNTLIDEDTALLAQYKEFETMVGECANVNLSNTNVSKSKWLLRMEMDPETMLEKNITMDDIHFTLNNIYKDQISCVFSDYNADKLVFRVRMTEVIKQNASKTAVNKKPLNQSDQIYILKNFQDNLLKNVVIRGVKGIKKVSMRKVKNNMVEHNGTYVTEDQWVLDTAGSNLLDVLALDYIDYTKTYSNDIIETFEVLGIEAARQAIFNEFVDVIKFDGTYIDYHHFALLCDRMCYSESPISIYRHGIKNDNIGVLAKASFEETADMLMNAAKHGELDVMTGVSANVMCGQEGLYGTNAFKVLLDMSEIGKMKPSAEYKYLNREKELADMLKEGAIAADADECGVKNLSVQNGVVNIAGADMGEQNDDYTPF